MFRVYRGELSGVRVQGSGGLIFPHVPIRLEGGEVGLQPQIGLHVQSDKISSVWYPQRGPLSVKLDTGADSSYLHSNWLYSLGIRDDSRVKTYPVGADGKKIPSKKKLITIRIVGFDEPMFIWINYSDKYRKDLFNLGLGALAPYYRIVLTEKETILYRFTPDRDDVGAPPR